jgi:hypothetical protein
LGSVPKNQRSCLVLSNTENIHAWVQQGFAAPKVALSLPAAKGRDLLGPVFQKRNVKLEQFTDQGFWAQYNIHWCPDWKPKAN